LRVTIGVSVVTLVTFAVTIAMTICTATKALKTRAE
jgi:hypothetical protein